MNNKFFIPAVYKISDFLQTSYNMPAKFSIFVAVTNVKNDCVMIVLPTGEQVYPDQKIVGRPALAVLTEISKMIDGKARSFLYPGKRLTGIEAIYNSAPAGTKISTIVSTNQLFSVEVNLADGVVASCENETEQRCVEWLIRFVPSLVKVSKEIEALRIKLKTEDLNPVETANLVNKLSEKYKRRADVLKHVNEHAPEKDQELYSECSEMIERHRKYYNNK